MDNDLNATVFALVRGAGDNRDVVSVWSSRDVAERNAELLNAGMRYVDYEVKEVSLDSFGVDTAEASRRPGVRATYDAAEHGWDVKKENVVFEEALVGWVTHPTYVTRTSFVVIHESEDDCVEMLREVVSVERDSNRNFW